MVRKLIEWAVDSALIVILLAIGLAGFGVYAFNHVNVEAYPDPAPAIIEVIAQYPGFSAEEVERKVTIPLEITLAGMPGLVYTRSKSLAGLSHLRNQFEYGIDYYAARQEVINRLQFVQGLPDTVTAQLSPFTPTGELIRYTLDGPKNSRGEDIYSLIDLKSLQNWVLEREFRRIPRIADVSSFGGMVKRYEIQPDPDRLKRYGVTLQQFQTAISNSNANVGAGYLRQGPIAMNVRGIGLLGRGQDPMQRVLNLKSPYVAARRLRQEEQGASARSATSSWSRSTTSPFAWRISSPAGQWTPTTKLPGRRSRTRPPGSVWDRRRVRPVPAPTRASWSATSRGWARSACAGPSATNKARWSATTKATSSGWTRRIRCKASS